MAATLRLASSVGDGARLRPRDDFHQEPADAHAGEFGARDLEPREKPHQHPVKAVFDRRARAARRAQHRHAAGAADQQQIAGIDRHAEMLDRAADLGDRGRDHVAPVGDRGRAEHDHQFGAEAEQFLDRFRQSGLVVRHAALGDDAGAGRRQPLRRHAQGLVDHLWRKPRQQRRDHADLLDDVGRNPQRDLARDINGRVAQLRFDAERNELYGRDHLAFDHRLEGRERRKGDRFVDTVDAVDRSAIDDQHAGLRREQIGSGR